MARHAVVTHEEWVSARKALLEREKALTREHDELSHLGVTLGENEPAHPQAR